MMPRKRLLGLAAIALFAAGCHTDMWVQPKLKAQDESDFPNWSDHMASRLPVTGTVARGQQRDDLAYYTGKENGKYVTDIPFLHAAKDLNIVDESATALTPDQYRKFLERGQERFGIYCTPCHGQLGDGNGMIAERGLALRRPPATYHTDRLRKMPIGHFFDVMTNGYGVMFSYASRVEVPDRWAIASYIRVLQLSENMRWNDFYPEERRAIKETSIQPPSPR